MQMQMQMQMQIQMQMQMQACALTVSENSWKRKSRKAVKGILTDRQPLSSSCSSGSSYSAALSPALERRLYARERALKRSSLPPRSGWCCRASSLYALCTWLGPRVQGWGWEWGWGWGGSSG